MRQATIFHHIENPMEDMEQLRQELGGLKVELSGMKKLLSQVHYALVGNDLTKDGGMTRRLEDAEKELLEFDKRLAEAEKKQIRYNVYTVIMWACVGATGMAIFAYLVQFVFSK